MKSGPSKRNAERAETLKLKVRTALDLDVDFDTKSQTIQVRDARLINAQQRAFCRRLLEAAARRPGIGKAEVDLASASCRSRVCRSIAELAKDGRLLRGLRAGSGCVDFRSLGRSRCDRKAHGWLKMTAYPLANDVSLWETFDAKRDRVKLRHQFPAEDERQLPLYGRGHFSAGRCRALQGEPALEELDGRLPPFDQRAERVHGSSRAELRGAAGRRRAPRASNFPGGAVETAGRHLEVATGPKRLLYLGLAGGSFVMTLVGLVDSGDSDRPFLLATSYFLARSSRWLDRKLRESVFFGSIVTEWEEHGGLGRTSKAKLMAVSGAIVVVAIIVSPLSPLGILLLLVVSSLSPFTVFIGCRGLKASKAREVSLGTPRLALPAP